MPPSPYIALHRTCSSACRRRRSPSATPASEQSSAVACHWKRIERAAVWDVMLPRPVGLWALESKVQGHTPAHSGEGDGGEVKFCEAATSGNAGSRFRRSHRRGPGRQRVAWPKGWPGRWDALSPACAHLRCCGRRTAHVARRGGVNRACRGASGATSCCDTSGLWAPTEAATAPTCAGDSTTAYHLLLPPLSACHLDRLRDTAVRARLLLPAVSPSVLGLYRSRPRCRP